jgi:hypothetical protein
MDGVSGRNHQFITNRLEAGVARRFDVETAGNARL